MSAATTPLLSVTYHVPNTRDMDKTRLYNRYRALSTLGEPTGPDGWNPWLDSEFYYNESTRRAAVCSERGQDTESSVAAVTESYNRLTLVLQDVVEEYLDDLGQAVELHVWHDENLTANSLVALRRGLADCTELALSSALAVGDVQIQFDRVVRRADEDRRTTAFINRAKDVARNRKNVRHKLKCSAVMSPPLDLLLLDPDGLRRLVTWPEP